MATESAAVRVAREYREQLARNEDAALRRMSRYWANMERELEPQFIALSQEIRELQESGQPVPPQYIYTMKRYQDMMAQILEEIPDFEKYAVDVITDYQVENFNLGLEDASAVIQATKPSDAIWNRVGKDAAETAAGFAGNGAPLAELLQHDYGDLGAKVTDALVSGIGLGKGVFAVARDMRDAMGMEYNRSVRIARTEINRAYRIANAMQYEKSGVVTKVLRLAYKPTACFACLLMDGEECPRGICDDHPNGKCATIAVTVGGIYPEWQHGEDWLMEQTEEDQRRIIGDGRFEMWKRDGIPLRDMVEMKPNPVWGGSPTVISEKELRNKFYDNNGALLNNAKKLVIIPNVETEIIDPNQKIISGISVTVRQESIPMPSGSENIWLDNRDCNIYKTSDGVEFVFPIDMNEEKQGMTIERAIQGWNNVPESIRKQAQKRIYFVDYENPKDDYWKRRYRNFTGTYATGGQNEITFYTHGRHNLSVYRDTLAHEIGHRIDQHGKISRGVDWIKAMKDDNLISKMKSPTEYGKNSNSEDFAESIANYVSDYEWMMKNFPNRMRILKSILGDE